MANQPTPPTAPVCTASPLHTAFVDKERGDGADTLGGTEFTANIGTVPRKIKTFEGWVADMANGKVGVRACARAVGRAGGREGARACVRVCGRACWRAGASTFSRCTVVRRHKLCTKRTRVTQATRVAPWRQRDAGNKQTCSRVPL